MNDDGTAGLFTRIGEAYERIQVPAIFAPWAEDFLQTAALKSGERVLDVACGTGIVARLASPRVRPGGQVVGLDLNEGMLAVARVQAEALQLPIEWRQGDATTLPLPDAAFDVVLCQQALQFMPNRRAALREMRRVLAPRGRAVISTWHYREDHELWDRLLAGYVAPAVVSRIRAQSPRITRDLPRPTPHVGGCRPSQQLPQPDSSCPLSRALQHSSTYNPRYLRQDIVTCRRLNSERGRV